MQRKTKWFTPNIKPARKGVYEVKETYDKTGGMASTAGYAYFDGKVWGVAEPTPSWAMAVWSVRGGTNAVQDKPWRGLLKKGA